jgi:dTDP-glucose pyrophosphorylase/CBS domain-containing protein
MNSVEQLFVSPTDSIREMLVRIDRAAQGIALVVDAERRLLATVTDGDVRRAMLAGLDLDLPVGKLLTADGHKFRSDHPVTAPNGTPDDVLLQLMNERTLRQIPLVDDEGRVVNLIHLNDLAREYESPLRAVVMAGGLGTRLRPLTEEVPKPMLPVGDRPLLEIIVNGLRDAGIRQVNVTTHYKANLIAEHFKNGEGFGVDIRYVNEDQPLGTAGAISLLEDSDDPLLVINGDILTRVDFKAMLDFHREYNADLTVAVRQYEFRVPYGVIETDGVLVRAISEKPVVRQFINAGIYLLNPAVKCFIPNGQHYDVPELIDRLLQENRPVVCFPIREYWLDIGKSEHYDQANLDIAAGRF